MELEQKHHRSQMNSPDKQDNEGSPEKQDNERCITCKKLADSDVIECQWCVRNGSTRFVLNCQIIAGENLR